MFFTDRKKKKNMVFGFFHLKIYWNGCFLGCILLFFRGIGSLVIDLNDIKKKKKTALQYIALRKKVCLYVGFISNLCCSYIFLIIQHAIEP